MLSLQQIRAFLAALGIKILAVEFDSAKRQIIARGNLRGQAFVKQISFTEIESAFTDTDSANADAPTIDLNLPAGINLPKQSE